MPPLSGPRLLLNAWPRTAAGNAAPGRLRFGPVTAITYDCVPVFGVGLLSVAVTLIGNVPACVGLPDSVPVPVLNAMPVGSAPDST